MNAEVSMVVAVSIMGMRNDFIEIDKLEISFILDL